MLIVYFVGILVLAIHNVHVVTQVESPTAIVTRYLSPPSSALMLWGFHCISIFRQLLVHAHPPQFQLQLLCFPLHTHTLYSVSSSCNESGYSSVLSSSCFVFIPQCLFHLVYFGIGVIIIFPHFCFFSVFFLFIF